MADEGIYNTYWDSPLRPEFPLRVPPATSLGAVAIHPSRNLSEVVQRVGLIVVLAPGDQDSPSKARVICLKSSMVQGEDVELPSGPLLNNESHYEGASRVFSRLTGLCPYDVDPAFLRKSVFSAVSALGVRTAWFIVPTDSIQVLPVEEAYADVRCPDYTAPLALLDLNVLHHRVVSWQAPVVTWVYS